MSALTRPRRDRGVHVLAFLGATGLIWLATISWPAAAVPALDPSWQLTLSAAWAEGWRYGHDIAFTWGPLGWWLNPYVVPAALDDKLLFEMTGRIGIAAVLAALGWSLPVVPRLLWLATIVVFGAGMFDSVLLATAVGLALLWMAPHSPRWQLAVAIVVLGALAVVKFTMLALIAVATVVAALVAWLHGRRPRAVVIAAGVPAAVIGWWLVAGQQVQDLLPFLVLSADVAAGYGGAMGIDESDLVFWTGLVVLSGQAAWITVVAWTQRRQPPALAQLALMSVATYLAWKHGYTRADAHVVLFYGSALLLSLVGTGLPGPARLPAGLGVALALLSLGAVELTYPGVPRQWLAGVQARVVVSGRMVWSLDAVRASFPTRADAFPAQFRLPTIRQHVGDDTVDVLGFEQGLIAINDLRHRPRPVFQSYVAYSPRLAEVNRAFLHSADAPTYVLASLGAIDGRYPSQDDAGLLRDLPFTYRPVVVERGQILMRRLDAGEATHVALTEVSSHVVAPGEVVRLPEGRDHAVWMTIDAEPTLRARARGLLYREPMLWLTMTDDRGTPSHWRVVPRLAAYGFLVQPRLVTAADLQAWAYRSGETWNGAVAIGTGTDSHLWKRFTVRFHRLSPPLSPTRPSHLLVAQGITNAEPRDVSSAHPWRINDDDRGTRLFLHAPGQLDLVVPAGGRRLRAAFGLEPGSYAGAEGTDGVTLIVEALDARGVAVPIWERTITPMTRPGDRGDQDVDVVLPSPAPDGVRLRFTTGATGAWDWSYLANVRIE